MPDNQLRFRVFWLYSAHGIASNFLVIGIHIFLLRIFHGNPTKKRKRTCNSRKMSYSFVVRYWYLFRKFEEMINKTTSRTNNIEINAWINNKWEYRYNVESKNHEIIQGSHQWFNSRQSMENNMKLNGLNPNVLPSRITKK